MQAVSRLLINICVENLETSKAFYQDIFDFEPAFDSDWFVQLHSASSSMELGLILRTHELIPADFQQAPQGSYITFVVPDADAAYELAKASNYTVVQEPTDTFYGQRRLLLQDPDGMLVDVSSLIPNFQFGG